eukprot:Skav228870  [mRNA]  locus=scaffold816:373219:374256:+ [translate_table: standard]
MTWFCRPCETQNSDAQSICRSCHRPWEEVWAPSRRKRSQSAWRRNGKKDKKDDKEGKEKAKVTKTAGPLEEMFQQDLPWVTTTPQSRTNPRQVVEAQGSTDLPLVPPQPPVQPPPVAKPATNPTLSSEEAKQHSHLKGLLDLGLELPSPMRNLYQELADKMKASAAVPISHGQIHKMNKLKTQISTYTSKIHAMDQQWSSFMNCIMTKVRDHSQQYQQCRADLITNLAAKQEELKTIKLAISKATQQLSQDGEEDEPIPDPQGLQAQIQELQFHQQLAQGQVQIVEDDLSEAEMEDHCSDEDEEDKQPRPKAGPHTTFRGAPSPNRVANLQLKEKAEKAKDKKAK